MRNKRIPKYPDDVDYNTNSPSYYDDLARKQKLMQLLAEKIWDYDDEIKEYFKRWEDNLENINEDVIEMMVQWLEDGTLDHIINDTIFNWKADKTYVDAEIERLDQKDEDLTEQKADKTFVDTEIERLDQKDEDLTTQLTQTLNRMNDMYVNVKDYGAHSVTELGYESFDSTEAIQNAIDTGYNVLIPKGKYLINGTRKTIVNPSGAHLVSGLFPKSNQKITFEHGAVLKVIPNSSVRYCVFGVHKVENVVIENAILEGDRTEHTVLDPLNQGEWGFGIYIQSSKNVKLINCEAYDFWGDGFVVGTTNLVDSTLKSKDVQLIDCYSHNNRRQGLSVTGADNVTVLRGRYSSTNGTQPSTGIDFESDSVETANHNCKVIGVELLDNDLYGIMGTINGDILIQDCYFSGNKRQSLYFTSNNNVRVINCKFDNEGVLHLEKNLTDEKFITFRGCEIILDSSKSLITATGVPAYIGSVNWYDNKISYGGSTGETITVLGSNDSRYLSQFNNNEVIIPNGFNAEKLISSNIIIYSDDNLQMSDNIIQNKSNNSLRLFYGGTKSIFGKPNIYLGDIVDDGGKVNGDLKSYLVAIGNIEPNTMGSWTGINVGSAKEGSLVEINPLFNANGLIFSGDIYPDGKLNIYVFNPTTAPVVVNNNVSINIEQRY